HASREFADQLEVVPRLIGALVIEQYPGIVGIAADGAQRLIEFMADAGAHGTQRRELSGLQQLVLSADQFLLGLLALQNLRFEAAVERFQSLGALLYAALELLACPRIQGDALQ